MRQRDKYNPHIHHRRSIRLKGYDYAQAGLYFITICCQDRMCRFGEIINGEMILNEYGQIAHDEWMKLSERFSNFELDVFQIMPNHMHGIIALTHPPVGAGFTPAQNTNGTNNRATVIDNRATVGAGFTPAQNTNGATNGATVIENRATARVAPTQNTNRASVPENENAATPTVSDMVGAYKSLVANACLEIYKSKNETMGKLWQRNYHEHIIRNEQSYHTISEYILNNPAKWAEDKFYMP